MLIFFFESLPIFNCPNKFKKQKGNKKINLDVEKELVQMTTKSKIKYVGDLERSTIQMVSGLSKMDGQDLSRKEA